MWGGPAVVCRWTSINNNGESPSGVARYTCSCECALYHSWHNLTLVIICILSLLSLFSVWACWNLCKGLTRLRLCLHTSTPVYAYTLIHLFMLTQIHLGVDFCLHTWHWCMHFCHLLPTIVTGSKAFRQLCLRSTCPRICHFDHLYCLLAAGTYAKGLSTLTMFGMRILWLPLHGLLIQGPHW